MTGFVAPDAKIINSCLPNDCTVYGGVSQIQQLGLARRLEMTALYLEVFLVRMSRSIEEDMCMTRSLGI